MIIEADNHEINVTFVIRKNKVIKVFTDNKVTHNQIKQATKSIKSFLRQTILIEKSENEKE